MPAPEEGSPCQWRRVGGFQYQMSAAVYQRPLVSGVIAPQHENESVLFIGQGLYDRIGESLPTDVAVRSRRSGSYCEDGVQQEYALSGPSFQIAACRYRRAGVSVDLLVDVLQ